LFGSLSQKKSSGVGYNLISEGMLIDFIKLAQQQAENGLPTVSDTYGNHVGSAAFPDSSISSYDNWQFGTSWSIETTDVRSGTTALRATGTNATAQIYESNAFSAATAGQTMHLRGWVKWVSGGALVNEYGITQGISIYQSGASTLANSFELDRTTTEWQYFEISKPVDGTGTKYIILVPANGTMIADDLEAWITTD